MADQKEKKKWGWGFLGAGRIASDFATALKSHPSAELVAVGASNLKRAKEFGDKFGFKSSFDSYHQVVACSDVHVVYVNRTHNFHVEDVKLALEHNKAVLCEKPLTITSRQSEELIKLAREKKVFLMMGVWTRFFPSICRVVELINSGEIGEVTSARSDFGFKGDFADPKRIDLSFGPGTLLDIGIYCVFWSGLACGSHSPSLIRATGKVENGVDVHVGGSLVYGGDKVSTFISSFTSDFYNEADVVGTKGRIRLCKPFHAPTKIKITKNGEKERVEEFPLPDAASLLNSQNGRSDFAFIFPNSNGMIYEIEHVTECLDKGLTESPLLPLNDTFDIMKTLDQLRGQIGVVYPFDGE